VAAAEGFHVILRLALATALLLAAPVASASRSVPQPGTPHVPVIPAAGSSAEDASGTLLGRGTGTPNTASSANPMASARIGRGLASLPAPDARSGVPPMAEGRVPIRPSVTHAEASARMRSETGAVASVVALRSPNASLRTLTSPRAAVAVTGAGARPAALVPRDRHWHGGFPGGYDNPLDPEGPPIPFTSEPAPGVRDYNGALLPERQPDVAEPG
jgi:hypothetical protein